MRVTARHGPADGAGNDVTVGVDAVAASGR